MPDPKDVQRDYRKCFKEAIALSYDGCPTLWFASGCLRLNELTWNDAMDWWNGAKHGKGIYGLEIKG